MLTKLSEVLFVDTLRRHATSLPDETTGWLSGARDPVVGKSLALLHSRPSHSWTVAGLAGTSAFLALRSWNDSRAICRFRRSRI
jgi:hypothetical protein